MHITNYLTYDSPIPYKKLLIYPITVKDYVLFSTFSTSLLLDKNVIPDAKIISMTDLEYLVYLSTKKENPEPYLLFFDRLLALCLKDDKSFEDIEESIRRYRFDNNKKPYFVISENDYNNEDYKEIKYIIAAQNSVTLPDKNMSKEVRDSLQKARDYKIKLSGAKPASFEDYIISLSVTTGWTLEYIYSMSIRKFFKAISRMDNLIHYRIYLASALSGMVEYKDKSFIKHWLINLDSDNDYSDVSMDLDTIKNKVSLESAKQ